MPVCEEKKRFNGKWHIREKRLFPGYLFLVTEQLELLQKELEKIESVTKLLGVGKDIVPLSEEEVCFIRQLTGDSDTVKMSEGIIEHDKVRVLCGPLVGLESTICKIDRHKRKAWINTEMFGRQQLIEVGLEVIKKI